MAKKKNVITLSEARQRYRGFLEQKVNGTIAVSENY